MRRVLRSLIVVALLATLGATGAYALAPDDAIRLAQEGVDDRTIIAKICSDGDAWDLTADDIVYLRDQGVSDEVVQALIDPAAAAERYGFTTDAGESQEPAKETAHTAYVFSLGYYYGPLARFYYYDPFFYDYLYSGSFAFSYAYWPTFYASYCWPYSYGYYPYPYFWYPYDSYYYGYGYCGANYSQFYGPPPPGAGRYYGDVRWRDGAGRNGPPARGSNFGSVLKRRLAAKDPNLWTGRGSGNTRWREWARNVGRSVARDRASVRDPIIYRSRTPGEGGAAGNRSYRQRGVLRPRDPARSFERRGVMRAPERGVIRPPDRGVTREPERGVQREPQRDVPRRSERETVRQPERANAPRESYGRSEQPPARGRPEETSQGRGERGRR